MPKKERLLTADQITAEIQSFRKQQQTLILASQSADKQPLASYAPFVEDDAGNFYCLLSGLASHSSNLQQHQIEQSQISVLFIEDEQNARNLFARKRLNYDCSVTIYTREATLWQEIIDKLQDKFGKTIEVLVGLGDFKLYCLTPVRGHYVRGFSLAYELEGAQKPLHIKK